MSLTIRDKYDPDHSFDLGVTVDESISFIIETLEDPLNPRWCAACIVACMSVIKYDHNTAESLINKYHPFGSTIVAFLTAERSVAEIEALASRWSACSCSSSNVFGSGLSMRVHRIVVGMMPVLANLSADPKNRANGKFEDKIDVFGIMVNNLAGFIKDAVGKVKPFSLAKGRHPEIWPATPTDLIPYRPETTVESLVTWSRFMGSAQLLSLLHFFVRICGPMIIPAIVASRSAPKYIVEHGSKVCFDVSNASTDLNGQIDDLAAKNFMTEMGHLFSIVNSFLTIPPLLNRDLHFGIAQRAFDFAAQAISTIESPIIPQTYTSQMKPIIDTLAHYASVLWTTVPEQMTTPRARIHSAIRSAMDNLAKPSPPADFAYATMCHARSIQFCFAPGCPESAQSSGRVYMRCSGCRVVAYCSKACQKRAWTDEHVPHRNICKKMKQVYDVGGDYLRREEDQAKFVQEMKRAKIKDVVLKEIGIWMCEANTRLQRKGPLFTAEAREYLSQKEGPRFTPGTREFMSEIETSLLSNPKRRRARG